MTSIPKELPDAGLDATAVEDGESVADEPEEGVHDVVQRLNGGCDLGRQSAIVQCLGVLAVIKRAAKLPFAELLYKAASRSLIFLGFPNRVCCNILARSGIPDKQKARSTASGPCWYTGVMCG